MSKWLSRQRQGLWHILGGVSLRIKIMGIALAMIALLGLGVTWQVRWSMSRALAWELEQRGVSIARNLALQSTDRILTNDLYTLYTLARDTVVSNDDVRYAFILDPQGNLLSHSFQEGFPADLLDANEIGPDEPSHIEKLQTEEGVIVDVAVPIFEGRAGVARVGMSYRRLNESLADVTRHLFLTTLLVSLLGVGVSSLLTWLLTRPVLALAEATRRVAAGDLSHRITVWAEDEIGHLQASFNSMVEQLERSRREVEAYNESLLRRNRELGTLYAISRAVAGPLELKESLRRALKRAMEAVGAAGGWVCMVQGEEACEICVSLWNDSAPPDLEADCCRQCLACSEARTAWTPLVRSIPSDCPLARISAHYVSIPLRVKQQCVGLLNLAWSGDDYLAEEDLDLLQAIGRQLGVAVENARLWEEIRRKEQMRGELLKKVITAQEEERHRIARELHDETGQALTSLLVTLRLLEGAQTLEEARTLIQNMRQVVDQTLDEIHSLAVELRPSVLDDLGLMPALARQAQICQDRFGLQVDLATVGLGNIRLPEEIETTLYRIAQEALTNVARHAQASHVSLLLERRGNAVVLVIEDNGRGFDVTQAMDTADHRRRMGLYGMEERAVLAGGRLEIESTLGVGTTISVEIPLEDAWAEKSDVTAPFAS